MPVQLVHQAHRQGQARRARCHPATAPSTAVINTPGPADKEVLDGLEIRRAAVERGIPCITSIDTAPGDGLRDEPGIVGLQREAARRISAHRIRLLNWHRDGTLG